MSSIYGVIYDELSAMKRHLPGRFEQYKDAFDLLDREEINGIELDGDIYWIEWYIDGDPSESGITQLHSFLQLRGFKNLQNKEN